jgi:hypothetical protein
MEQDKETDELKEYIKKLIMSRGQDDEEIIDRVFLLIEMYIVREVEKHKEGM